MSKPKYVCSIDYYPNCRSCDSGYHSHLAFYNSLEEMLTFALNEMHDYELRTVYTTSGKELFEFHYITERHRCTGIKVNIRGLKLRTKDNGHGVLIWGREV